MKAKARLVDAKQGMLNGKIQLVFDLESVPDDDLNALSQKELTLEVKPFKAKRSLDANAYCWVLLDKLAKVSMLPKEEIYRTLIRNIGGNSEVVCVRSEAVEKLCDGWKQNGIGWQTDTFPSKLKGCTNVILYYGSSTYTTEQMSRLIESVVAECEAQGIPTETPTELANMLSLWKEAERG